MNSPIFIDFEANMAGEAFLAALSIDGEIEQWVLHPDLAPLSFAYQIGVMQPDAFAARVVRLSRQLDRPIAGYSMHDARLLQQLLGTPPARYLNMARAAKAWIRKTNAEAFSRMPTYRPNSKNRLLRSRTWSLLAVAKFIGASTPPQYGYGKTIARVTSVRNGLLRTNGDLTRLTPTQKRKIINLLAHNRFDVTFLSTLYASIASTHSGLLTCPEKETA